jgi:hypothetical protein
MSSQHRIVEDEALRFTAEERALLADRWVPSLLESNQIEDAQATDVERRIEEIGNGHSRLLPASEAIARARSAIK